MILTVAPIVAQATPSPAVSAAPAVTPSPEPAPTSAAIDANARKWFEAFAAGKLYDASQLTPQAKTAFTDDVLSQVHAGLAPGGVIKTFVLTRSLRAQGVNIYVYNVVMQSGLAVTYMYAVDDAGKVAGIRFSPAAQ